MVEVDFEYHFSLEDRVKIRLIEWEIERKNRIRQMDLLEACVEGETARVKLLLERPRCSFVLYPYLLKKAFVEVVIRRHYDLFRILIRFNKKHKLVKTEDMMEAFDNANENPKDFFYELLMRELHDDSGTYVPSLLAHCIELIREHYSDFRPHISNLPENILLLIDASFIPDIIGSSSSFICNDQCDMSGLDDQGDETK
eukprot:TRINITY_DN522_c0_g1_i1.p1 TRINITY_DN522_c0_g1~~TRINITY_DN522_c0_g1_i1.p1  ORF type:complete len:199 (+),score=38.99 TRINITY_DN522_c0_g1_i1:106-702(+)